MSSKEANERRIAAITEADLLDLMERAAAYASRLVAQKSWRGAKPGVLPEGRSVQDLVQSAFEKVLEGAKWDDGKDLAMILEGIIRGMVGNLAKSWENRRFSNPDDATSPEGEDAWVSAVDRFPSTGGGPAEIVARREDDDLILETIESLEAGSPERRIVEAIFSGAAKREEVLAETGMGDKEYEAAKKRLRRCLEHYRQECASAQH